MQGAEKSFGNIALGIAFNLIVGLRFRMSVGMRTAIRPASRQIADSFCNPFNLQRMVQSPHEILIRTNVKATESAARSRGGKDRKSAGRSEGGRKAGAMGWTARGAERGRARGAQRGSGTRVLPPAWEPRSEPKPDGERPNTRKRLVPEVGSQDTHLGGRP